MHLPGSYHSEYHSFTEPTWQGPGSHGPFFRTSRIPHNVQASSGLQLSECKASTTAKDRLWSSHSK